MSEPQRKPSPLRSKRRRVGMALLPPPPTPTSMSLVKELYNLAQEVGFYEKPKLLQQRNQSNIIRRIRLLTPLLEEIRDSKTPLPPSAILAFREIHLTIQRAKLLLEDCREGSRLWLAMQTRRVGQLFNELTHELAGELTGLPLDLLEVSVEVKEQIELLRLQSKRATPIVESRDEMIRGEIARMLSEVESRAELDPTRLAELFSLLEIGSGSECQQELRLLEELEGEELLNEELVDLRNIISFLRYCKCLLFGVVVEESDQTEVPHESAAAASSLANEAIPDEFKCPISLELMRDPVIIATGQTYDRSSIKRWIDSGHSTCPKSGSKLEHINLIPNHALRSLIRQWCEDRKIPYQSSPDSSSSEESSLKKKKNPVSNTVTSQATRLTAVFLVGKLASSSPEVQKQVAYELRLLAKCGGENRVCIAQAGAIPLLVPLLSSRDSRTQEHAITALLNLSICDSNKRLIVDAGAIDPILKVLENGASMESRENAAATLFSLSVVDEYKVEIGKRGECFQHLVSLLREGSGRGKRDAATALFNLAVYQGNRGRIVVAGAVPLLVELLEMEDSGSEIAEDALAVLALLASSAEGLLAITGARPEAIRLLVGLMRSGSGKGKENATAVLLALCRSGAGGDGDVVKKLLGNSATVPSLYQLLATGTPRAKRKASSLLRILHRSERSSVIAPPPRAGGATITSLALTRRL